MRDAFRWIGNALLLNGLTVTIAAAATPPTEPAVLIVTPEVRAARAPVSRVQIIDAESRQESRDSHPSADAPPLPAPYDKVPRLPDGLTPYGPGVQQIQPWPTSGYRFGWGVFPPDAERTRDFVRTQARQREREHWRLWNRLDMDERKQKLLSAHGRALRTGVRQLRAGAYREAAISLRLAAQLNQADPACRIHLAQALIAIGHDSAAAEAIERALSLQPKLVYLTLGLDGYYPTPDGLASHVTALAERVAERRRTLPSASRFSQHLLVSFLALQAGDLELAYAGARRAAYLNPRHESAATLVELTRPAD